MTSPNANPLDTLPHRPPFRFLSRIVALEDGVAGKAIWQVSGEESFFSGHFPGDPIVPGVLIAEALAQLSGLIGHAANDAGGAARSQGAAPKEQSDASPTHGKLAHVEIRFNDAVHPPADILLSSRLTGVLGMLSTYEVEAHANDKLVARGRLTLAMGSELGT